ncbi:fibrinogen silencer-binding protein-like [Anoplophora glabripennis]|uniref:fibrinogen silencer-binding protein-like n=1 Tax=Anoplophora glabripennis TaxID=217634 RepID=UPI000875A188|nr:fibrinogen silencer-binding protein-like [Anoplophora glabripennis]
MESIIEDVKRSRNFTDLEKHILFDLVMQYKNIIENKKTDGTTVKQKKDCWDEITRKYNSNAQTGTRTAKQLHALYDTIKKKARKNLHDDKKNLYKTGGGTFTPQSDELDKKVLTILKPQYEPLCNPFDSSASYFKENLSPNIDATNEVETEEIIQIIQEEIPSHNSVELTAVYDLNPSSSEFMQTVEHTFDSATPSLASKIEKIAEPLTVSTVTPSTSRNLKRTPAKKRKIENMEILAKRIIKEKELEFKIQELKHNKKLQEIELEIKNKELDIVSWEHTLKSIEYNSRLESADMENLNK